MRSARALDAERGVESPRVFDGYHGIAITVYEQKRSRVGMNAADR